MTTSPQPSLIFVSHSHEDDEFSHQLVADLRDNLGAKTEIWHDISGGLRGGDQWWNVIVNKLSACDTFLLVMSPAALGSEAVGAELNMAWARKFQGKTRIIPILFKHCQPRLDLTTLQYISFLPPKTYDRALGELIAALLLPVGAAQVALPETEVLSRMSKAPLLPDAVLPERTLPDVVPTLLIVSIASAFPPRLVSFPGASLTIGRDPINDLVIADPAVSRQHLRLERAQTGWQVWRQPDAGDLLVNGQSCTEAGLHSGDQVVIGGTILRFELPDALPETNSQGPTGLPRLHTLATPPQCTVDCRECHFVAPLRMPVITLGRGPDNALIIPSPLISTHHATLRYTPGDGYIIEDAGSRNGLTLHGQRVQRHALKSGDTLLIGADMPGQTVMLTYTSLQ